LLGSDYAIDVVSDEEPKMRKTASAPSKPNYEDSVPNEIYERHIMSVMDKQAAAHTELMGTLSSLEARIADEHADVLDGLRKTSSFEFQTLCNVHGDRLATAFKDYMPERVFKKTAGAVDPETVLSVKVARLLDDIDQFRSLNNAIAEYQEGLDEFCKSAAEYAKGMRKNADAASTLRAVSAVTGAAMQSADKVRQATLDALGAGFDNASKLKSSARPEEDALIAPGSVMTSEFLVKDRFRDRMLGWSDMTADPFIANLGKPEEVFYVTQKVMDMNPALERPDHRETLRAMVAQILAQNGRAGLADIGALATLEQGFGRTRRGAAEEAAAPVLMLEKKTGPETPELISIVQAAPKADKDYASEAMKAYEEGQKADAAAAKDKAKAEVDAQKEVARADEQEMDKFNDWAEHRGLQAHYDPHTQQLDGYRAPGAGGSIIPVEQVVELFHADMDRIRLV